MQNNTPIRGVRVPPELEEAARRSDPALADVDLSTLLRVGLLMLAFGAAGDVIRQAVSEAGMKYGPKPRK
jgi:hypothetical protein